MVAAFTYYEYDASGRMTTQWSKDTADATYFTYNQRDMITKILRLPVGGDPTRTFSFNAVGERVVIDESGGTAPNYWTYDGYKLLTEKDNAGAEVRRYRNNASSQEGFGFNVEVHASGGTCHPVTDQGGNLGQLRTIEGLNDTFEWSTFGEVQNSFTPNGDRLRVAQALGTQALTTTQPFFVLRGGGVYLSRIGLAFGGDEAIRSVYGLLVASSLLGVGGNNVAVLGRRQAKQVRGNNKLGGSTTHSAPPTANPGWKRSGGGWIWVGDGEPPPRPPKTGKISVIPADDTCKGPTCRSGTSSGGGHASGCDCSVTIFSTGVEELGAGANAGIVHTCLELNDCGKITSLELVDKDSDCKPSSGVTPNPHPSEFVEWVYDTLTGTWISRLVSHYVGADVKIKSCDSGCTEARANPITIAVPCDKLDCLRSFSEFYNLLLREKHIRYDVYAENSNTFIARALAACGIFVKSPPHATGWISGELAKKWEKYWQSPPGGVGTPWPSGKH